MKRADLEPYQEQMVRFLRDIPEVGGCAWLDMGLGKTIIALTTFQDLKDNYAARKALVIAPKRVAMSSWPGELEEWEHLHLSYSVVVGNETARLKAVQANADVTIVTAEFLRWFVDNTPWRYDVVIIDDTKGFKRPSSKRFQILRHLRSAEKDAINRLYFLTGTPAGNGLLDIWCPVYLCDKGKRLGPSRSSYEDKFFFATDYNGYNLQIKDALKRDDGTFTTASDEIHERVKDICVSLTAEDVGQEYPVRVNRQLIDLPSKQRKEYEALERDLYLRLKDGDVEAVSMAVLSGKLRQYCSGALYDENKNVHDVHTLKLDALGEIWEENLGQPLLVTYDFKFSLSRIQKKFGKKVVHINDFDDTEARWNAGDIDILVGHPQNMSAGLNLQKGPGHTLVWYDPVWSLEDYLQMNKRLPRKGQKAPFVVQHELLVRNSIDDLVMVPRLQGKYQTEKALKDAVRLMLEKSA